MPDTRIGKPALVAAIVLGLVLLALLARLGSLEAGGPIHGDLELRGGQPATLYLPGDQAPAPGPPPLPAAERPPAVVLAHGFSSDRAGVSVLARRLARAGYAVLSFDFRGHGANRHPFSRGSFAQPDGLADDLAAAVDFLRTSPYVDGSRIVVMGHSMGAGAALDFGTRDSGLDGIVPISGGFGMFGPFRAPNVLFIFAEKDPQRIHSAAGANAATLAGVGEVVPGQTYGDLSRGTAVRLVEMPGEDHVSIVSSEPAAREIITWLDGIFGVARAEQPELGDPRLLTAGLALLAFLILLVPIGFVCGRLAPTLPERPAEGGVRGLIALAAALLASMAFLTAATPASFLSLQVYDVVVSHLLLAGVFLLAGLALRGDLSELRDGARWRRSLGPAAVAFLVVYVLLAPLGVVSHRLTPTPERLAVGIVAALLLFPFFLAFELQLRRGSAGRALLFGLLGRALILLVTYIGVLAGVLPPVVLLMLPVFAFTFVMVELLAASLYARSHDVLLVAMVESLWLAWIFAVTAPIRI
jgi:dienelactone hydrolase